VARETAALFTALGFGGAGIRRLAWPAQIHGAWGCTSYYEGIMPAVMVLAKLIVGAPPPISCDGIMMSATGCDDDGWGGAVWVELGIALALVGAVVLLLTKLTRRDCCSAA
jgi:hypothetical protein